MADFETAIAYVLKNEGGFVDDPEDHGGATNMGITQATLSEWIGRQATTDEVRTLTPQLAKLIYRVTRWNAMRLPEVASTAVATAIMDAAVLFGVYGASRSAQEALNMPGVVVDGHIGDATLAALAVVVPRKFINAFVVALGARIDLIVKTAPEDTKFKTGWANRINRYPLLAP